MNWYFKTGAKISNTADKFFEMGVKKYPASITKPARDIEAILRKVFPSQPLVLADGRYWTNNWLLWKDYLEAVQIYKKKWLLNRYDCDDFARAFQALASKHLGLNSVVYLAGHVYDLEGRWKFGHLFSAVITAQDEVFIVDPTYKGVWKKYSGGKLIMNNQEYRTLSLKM